MTRFRLRSLMILVALAAVGLWAAIWISRIWASVQMALILRSEANPHVSIAYMIVVLAVILALLLIGVGILVLALRIRAILRNSSPGLGSTRPDR